MVEISQEQAIEIRRTLLSEFHQLCEKNNWRYALAYGTLLGAVRHGGMIPWDDDIDLVMPREDYERLCEMYPTNNCKDRYQFVCNRNHPEMKTKIGYFIDYTTVTETVGNAPDYYGIHIDVYPLDIMPNDAKERQSLFRQRKVLQLLIRLKDLHPQTMKGVQKLARYLVMLLLTPVSVEKLYARLHALAGRWHAMPESERKEVCCLVEAGPAIVFPYAVTKKYKLYPYDGCEYPSFEDYDTPLRAWYGDYMQLPPESERVRIQNKWIRYFKKDE